MSDSANQTVNPDRLTASGPLATLEPVEHVNVDGSLSVGQTWHDLTIEALWPDGGQHAFIADHARLMVKVVVRAFPVGPSTEWRRAAWEQLSAMPDLQSIRCISAEEEGGWRYEVSAVPPPMNLQEWLACHRPGLAEIEASVRQLAATLGALHAQGVVHLNIRPSSIYIDESGPEPLFLLGGLQDATLYTQPDLMPLDVDPYYAPPESVDDAKHLSGTRWCAWDWWSIGRVLQEFLLGRHVLGVILDRDVSRVTPELRSRAELLLREKEPAGVRAGALDYMPAMELRLTPLLRGLLTGSCEARWSSDAVQRWIRHETVLDHYDLPRHARLWTWKGRGFTLAEAANHFTDTANWDEGEDLLFQSDRPETLAAFLAESPAHREDFERLQKVCDLSESTAWGDVPVVARRTVTAALAWLALANGSGVRTPLRIRGQNVDVVGLAELLRKSGSASGVALFTALLTPVVTNFVEPFDAAAVRVLKSIATKGGEAMQHGAQHGWLDPHDEDGRGRIFELALKAGALLRDPIEILRSLYATNSNAALAALLTEKNPGPRDSVILAFTAEKPERYGYITHDEWKRQQCAALQCDAERIVTVMFWSGLRQFLGLTRIWGMPTTAFAVIVLVLTAAAIWLSRSAGPASAIAGLLVLSRVHFWWRVRRMVGQLDPSARIWLWSDGLTRSARESDRAAALVKVPTLQLQPEFARLCSAMTALFSGKKGMPRITQPRWWDLWAVLGVSVVVPTVIFVQLFVQRLPTPSASQPIAVTAAGETESSRGQPEPASPPPATLWGVEQPVDIDTLVATGNYEVIDDGFGRQLRGPLREWTFFSSGEIKEVEIVAKAPASAEQSAFALVSGTLLLQPYPRRGIHVLLAVQVPTNRGFGFMIFNTRDRKVLNHEVLLIRRPLEERAWYRVGSQSIGYLGTPASLASEISLAPP